LRGGEFITSEVDELMNTNDHVEAACREIVMQTRDRHSVLIFAVSVDHAKKIKRSEAIQVAAVVSLVPDISRSLFDTENNITDLLTTESKEGSPQITQIFTDFFERFLYSIMIATQFKNNL
jgi:hypothetical protein